MGATLGVGIGAAAPAAGRPGRRAPIVAWPIAACSADLTAIAEAAQADAPGLQRVSPTPGAMLPDAGPSMLGVAQGAVTGTGGPGRTALVDALGARDVATGQRITGEVNRTFGPARVPSQVQEGIRGAQQALGPQYEAALAKARAVDTQRWRAISETQIINERGQAQAAMRQVRGMLDVPGNPATRPASGRHAADPALRSMA